MCSHCQRLIDQYQNPGPRCQQIRIHSKPDMPYLVGDEFNFPINVVVGWVIVDIDLGHVRRLVTELCVDL